MLRNPRAIALLVALVTTALFPATAGAQQFAVWPAEPVNEGSGQSFDADTMALDGQTLVIGASEGAYVFVANEGAWQSQATLSVDPPFHPAAVAIDGDTAVASELGSAVHVFARTGDTWNHEHTLVPSIPSSQYGVSIAIDGDTVVVSAGGFEGYQDEQPCAAYVYERSYESGGAQWSQTAVFFGDDAWGEDGYGASVDVDDDTVVVGETTPYGYGLGRVHIYTRAGAPSAWAEQATVHANTQTPAHWSGDAFGEAVAVSGDTLVVAASHDFTPEVVDFGPGWGEVPLRGAAHFFERSGATWSHQATLFPAYGAGEQAYDPEYTAYGPKSRFGRRVALSGDVAVVTGHRNAPTLVLRRDGSGWSWRKDLGTGFGALSLSANRFVLGGLHEAILFAFGEGTFVTPPPSCSSSIAASPRGTHGPTSAFLFALALVVRSRRGRRTVTAFA